MSHNLTLPEEIDIIMMELEANDKVSENSTGKNKQLNDQAGWYAGYIPPYRAAYLGNKENTTESK